MGKELELDLGDDLSLDTDKAEEGGPIDVGRRFYSSLINKNKASGEGIFTAIQFRNKFLKDCMEPDWWKDPSKQIVLSFKNVNEISPPWANEAFAYFISKEVSLRKFLTKVKLEGLSSDFKKLITKELDAGYRGSNEEE